MGIRHVAILLMALIVSGCASATVDLRNAPVGAGNINSRLAQLGDVYLWDKTTDVTVRVAQFSGVGFETKHPIKGGIKRETAHDAISIAFTGVAYGVQGTARAAIASSTVFEMTNYEEAAFSFPGDALNGHEVTAWRSRQGGYANDRYRFIFVHRVFAADSVSLKWNGEKDDGGNLTVAVPGVDVEVNYKNSNAVECGGVQAVCIITTQVFRLVEAGNGATGYEFVTDTSEDARVLLQRIKF